MLMAIGMTVTVAVADTEGLLTLWAVTVTVPGVAGASSCTPRGPVGVNVPPEVVQVTLESPAQVNEPVERVSKVIAVGVRVRAGRTWTVAVWAGFATPVKVTW
jgi:predicted component of type VI protein secretion system